MRKIRIIGLIIFLISIQSKSFAQISFSVSNNQTRYLELVPFYENNYSKTQIINFSQWINYTTLVNYLEPDFTINIQMITSRVPLGLSLTAEAGSYHGFSKSNTGTSSGKEIISNTKAAKILLENIATCYTGSGYGEGHKVNLTFSVPNRINTDTSSYTINIIYTIMQ
ncbi:MAG: hypothetical protein JXR65_11175 [Bacteroidales bacterium]|nr:hypothetical protein [Bacteroidales bacterium]